MRDSRTRRGVVLSLLGCAFATEAGASWPSHRCTQDPLAASTLEAIQTRLARQDIHDARVSEVCTPGSFLPQPDADRPQRLQIRLLREPHDVAGAVSIRERVACEVQDGSVLQCRSLDLQADAGGSGLFGVAPGIDAARIAELWPVARMLPEDGERVKAISFDEKKGDDPLAGHGYLIWTSRPGWCGDRAYLVRWTCADQPECGWLLRIDRMIATSGCWSPAPILKEGDVRGAASRTQSGTPGGPI